MNTQASQMSSQQTSSANDETKIQLLCLDGTKLVNIFKSDELLSAVRVYLKVNNKQGTCFSTQYPKKVFTGADFDSTLKELGLVPQAKLHVMLNANPTQKYVAGGMSVEAELRQKNHQEALAEIKRKKEQESEAKKKALLMFEEDRKELRRKAEQKKLIQPKVVESKPVLKPGENQTKIMVTDLDGSKYVNVFNSSDDLSAVEQFVRTKREEKPSEEIQPKGPAPSKMSRHVTIQSLRTMGRSRCRVPMMRRNKAPRRHHDDSESDSEPSEDSEESDEEPPKPQIKEGPIGFRSRYPKKEFKPSSADFQSSLKDLGLVPNAVLYVFICEEE